MPSRPRRLSGSAGGADGRVWDQHPSGKRTGEVPDLTELALRAKSWCGVYEKYMKGASGVDGRWMGLAMPVVCLSIPGSAEGSAGWSVRSHCRRRGARRPRCFYLRVLGALRPLRRLVRSCPCDRRRGSPGARTYSGQRPGETSGAYNRSLRQSTPVLSRCTAAWAACLTVNAAYFGRPVHRFVLALGGGPGPFVFAGWGRLPGRSAPSRRGCCGGGDRVAAIRSL